MLHEKVFMSESSTSIKGHFTLETDKNDQEALLSFSADPDGPAWDSTLLLKLLRENKIKTQLTEADLKKAIKDWTDNPEKSLVVSRGESGEETLHEYMDWSDIPIPDDLQDIAKSLFEKKDYPKVFKTITEKVKIKKSIKQKSSIPFLKHKEETKEEWVTQKNEIAVDVDPSVESTGYIQKGQIIGVIKPGKPGKPGKNIYGMVIKPEPIKPYQLFKSPFLTQQKDKLIAEKSGFIRRGNMWIELIPYYQESIEITKSLNGHICYLSYFPQSGSKNYPDVESILKKAEEIGFNTTSLIDNMDLEILLKRAAEQGEPLEKQVITKEISAFVKSYLSPDKSRAYLWLHKGNNQSNEIGLKEIGKAINQLSVTLNNKEEVKKDILDFINGPQLELKDYLLASGIPATKGKDGSIEWTCEFYSEKKAEEIKNKLKTLPDPYSIKDFSQEHLEKLAEVKENDEIGRIIQPSYGMTGKDLLGNAIPAIKGKDANIRVFENIRMSQNLIFAGISGILELGKKEDTTLLRIRDFADPRVQIETSADMLEAYLTFHPAKGGTKKISTNEIRALLKEKNIIKGIDEKIFQQIEQAQTENHALTRQIIAKGLAPIHGSGTQLVFKIAMPKDSGINNKAENTVSVKKGMIIAEILPPSTNPRDGWDISGKILKAQKDPEIQIKPGNNIKVEDRNGTKLFLANANGELFYNGELLEINDTKKIEGNIGPKTGHIKFTGSVHINGSVLPGYRVFSSGNIVIKEDVHESVVSADGSIYIENMVIGGGKSLIRAKDFISLGYAEASMLLSVGDIKIREGCRNNHVKCNSSLHIESESGVIEGGKIQVRKGLVTHHLGSREGHKTSVSFGQDYLIKDQIEVEEKKINEINKQIKQFDKKMLEWEKSQEQNITAIKKYRQAKLNALKIVEKRTFRLFMLREKFEEHHPSEITVKGTLYPGVILESHGRFHEIKEEKRQIVLYFNTENGKIEEKQLS